MNGFICVEELFEVCSGFDLPVPVALPFDLEMVAKIVFPLRGLVDIVQGTVGVADGISVAAHWETAREAVP